MKLSLFFLFFDSVSLSSFEFLPQPVMRKSVCPGRAAETQSLGKELYLGKLYLAVREWREKRFTTNGQTKKVFCTWQLTIWWAHTQGEYYWMSDKLERFKRTWKGWRLKAVWGLELWNMKKPHLNLILQFWYEFGETCWYSSFFLKAILLAKIRIFANNNEMLSALCIRVCRPEAQH